MLKSFIEAKVVEGLAHFTEQDPRVFMHAAAAHLKNDVSTGLRPPLKTYKVLYITLACYCNAELR